MNRGTIIDKYFNAYPDQNAEVGSDLEEKLGIMRECIVDLRVLAVQNRSVKELQEVQSLEHDYALLMGVLEQAARIRRNLSAVQK